MKQYTCLLQQGISALNHQPQLNSLTYKYEFLMQIKNGVGLMQNIKCIQITFMHHLSQYNTL